MQLLVFIVLLVLLAALLCIFAVEIFCVWSEIQQRRRGTPWLATTRDTAERETANLFVVDLIAVVYWLWWLTSRWLTLLD